MNQWLFLGAEAVRRSRKLKMTLIAGTALFFLLLGLAVWAAIALFGWLGGKAPSAWEAVRGQVPAVAQQVEEIVPGARQAVEAWLPGKSAARNDVPGEDLADILRYDGFVRTRYAAAEGERSVTYEGRGDFRAVADHYTGRLSEKGWAHRILYADGQEERHEYRSAEVRLELSVRDAGGSISVTLREAPLATASHPGGKAARSG